MMDRSQVMYVTLLAVILNVACASDESCLVNGITARWAMSYCMTRYETDDEAHPDVSACFLAELKLKRTSSADEDCNSNLVYKSAICSIAIEHRSFEGTLSECVRSDEMTPTVVSEGIG